MRQSTFRLIATVGLLLAPGVAFAHPGHGEVASLLAGFTHPFNGVDHLLAMTAVGMLAAHVGGRALWAVPATFVAVMALGGLLGAAGVSLPFVEIAIALSVLLFGITILSATAPPVLATLGLVGLFAIFHGHAHGSEMPIGSAGIVFGAGFMAATALLHGFGIALGLSFRRFDEVSRRRAMQACGVAIGLVGAALTINLV
jgi:urease accessory protein